MKFVALRGLAWSVVVLSVLASCASAPPAKAPQETEAPFASLQDKAIEMSSKGGMLAVVGIGADKTGRYDLALSKALLDGQAKVASMFQNSIQALVKNYTGTDGDKDPTVTASFEQAQKSVVSKTLNGVQQLSAARQIKDGDTITVGVLVGIDSKAVNSSFLTELKNQDQNLYDRFRASQAFAELNQAADKLDSK